jgi:glyoxylase-like metal-dependent hydrolase (beta-lactamase superfamily II)
MGFVRVALVDKRRHPASRNRDRGFRCETSTMTTLHWANADLEVHKLVVGPYDNNVFVIRCRDTGDSVLIDAANEHEQLLELCRRLDVRRVLETHGHWDHIQAVPALREAGYEVAVTAADAPMLKDVGYDVFLDDAEVIEVGNLRLHAIHNPGHTPGSISFQIEGTPLLFTGDTLFPGGPGNTKFEGGDFDTIISSIDSRLFTFPADTVVLPGHGVDTTIGAERPHLREWVERGW